MNRIALGLTLAAALSAVACYVPSPKTAQSETLSQSWPADGVESLAVSVTIGVGTLKLAGGASDAAQASISYNIPDWKPEFAFTTEQGLGRLTLAQPSSVVGATWPGNVRYEWTVSVSDSLPVRLDVEFGVGKADIDLRGVDVRRLDVDGGVGEGLVDLSGPRRSDVSVEVEAGVGKLTLILPQETPVEVEIDGGLGDVEAKGFTRRGEKYVNEAQSGPRITVDVEAGVGEVELRLAPAPAAGQSI